MALTQAEKTELINAIRAESIGTDELPVADSLTGVVSLPALRGNEAVSVPISLLSQPAVTAANAAYSAASAANAAADTANTTAANNTALIKQLQGNLQTVDWILKSISAGTDAPDSVKAKMRRVNAWSSEEDEREIVLLPGATEEAAGAMTAQQVKDLAALKNDAFEVILFDHIEESNIAANTSKVPLSASADGCKVVYCRARERFLFGVPAEADSTELTYYKDWEGSERYGTVDSQGVKPAEGKLFIDIAEANGNLLDIYIFREGALRHTGRSLYNYINDTAQSLDALENSKGKANGLATLDSSALVPEKHLPDKVFDVLTFNSVIEGDLEVRMQSSALKPGDEGVDLIYSDKADRFLLRVRESGTGKVSYYNNFKGSERYGTGGADGIVPYENKLYLDLYDGGVYYWYDLMLNKTDLDVSIRVDSLENKIGKANGIAPLNASGVVPNENISDEARKSLFCDLFNAAAGSAGYAKFTNGVWDCKLNGLTLSYDEAVLIYNVTNGSPATRGFSNAYIRTNLWNDRLGYGSGTAGDLCPAMLFKSCFSIEVIRFNGWVSDPRGMFGNCYKLTKVIGGFIGDDGAWPKNRMMELFPNSPLITSFQLERLQNDVTFANNPLIDLDSFTYMVEHRATHITDAYTVTVHADVYAKLTGDTTNEAAAALTAEELSQWQALLTKAAGKNIAFASA